MQNQTTRNHMADTHTSVSASMEYTTLGDLTIFYIPVTDNFNHPSLNSGFKTGICNSLGNNIVIPYVPKNRTGKLFMQSLKGPCCCPGCLKTFSLKGAYEEYLPAHWSLRRKIEHVYTKPGVVVTKKLD